MTPEQKHRTRIAVGVVLGFIIGVAVTCLIVNNPYDLLSTICVSAVAVPLCAFAGGFIAGVTDKS